jgi:hypothetical protein
MTLIETTDRAKTWVLVVGGVTVKTGITPLGCATGSSHTIYSADDANTLLNTLGVAGVSAPPMPDAGTDLQQGDIYDFGGVLYMVRQSHARTEHDPATIPALFTVYRDDAGEALDWVAGEKVEVGTRRLFEGVLYACLQAHQTLETWTPVLTLGVLWGVVATTAEWAVGVAYAGDNKAGAGNGDVVTYKGATYRCLQSHTSNSAWYPSAVGVINVLWVLVA